MASDSAKLETLSKALSKGKRSKDGAGTDCETNSENTRKNVPSLAQQFLNMKFVKKSEIGGKKRREERSQGETMLGKRDEMEHVESNEKEEQRPVIDKESKAKIKRIKEDREIRQYFVNQVFGKQLLEKNRILSDELSKMLDKQVLKTRVDSADVKKLKSTFDVQKKRMIKSLVLDYKLMLILATELEEDSKLELKKSDRKRLLKN